MWFDHCDPRLSVPRCEYVSSAQWNPHYSCPYLFWSLCTLLMIIIIRMFCPIAGLSLEMKEPMFQFCPKVDLPLQTQDPRWSFTSFPLLSAPHSLFSIWTHLKRSEKIPGAPTWRWGEWIWLTGPSGLHRNSPQGLNISFIRVFDQIRDPEIPIHPLLPTLLIMLFYLMTAMSELPDILGPSLIFNFCRSLLKE